MILSNFFKNFKIRNKKQTRFKICNKFKIRNLKKGLAKHKYVFTDKFTEQFKKREKKKARDVIRLFRLLNFVRKVLPSIKKQSRGKSTLLIVTALNMIINLIILIKRLLESPVKWDTLKQSTICKRKNQKKCKIKFEKSK